MHRLFNRKLLKFQGKEAFAFLQGLVTSDLTRASSGDARPALFLSSMGHVLSESFVFRREEDYFLDTHSLNVNRVLNIVKRRKLAAKVEVSPVESEMFSKLDYQVEDLLGVKEVGRDTNEKQGNFLKLADVRTKKLGHRCYNFEPLDNLADLSQGGKNEGKMGIYEKSLILNGCVLELLFENQFLSSFSQHLKLKGEDGREQGELEKVKGESLLEELKLMPFDFNLETFNYVDRNKGCYVGQEIVNRIVNKNLINKYILYLLINNNNYSNNNNLNSNNTNNNNNNKNDSNNNNNNGNNDLRELALVRCLDRALKGDGLWVAREWLRSELEHVKVEELTQETNKLVKEKKLIFVMFCGQFGVVLLNRNLRMNSLSVNGQSYSLEPFH